MAINSPTSAVSESEFSENDDRSETREPSNDDDDRASQLSEGGASLKRNSSLGMFGLKGKGKPSFSFGKRRTSRSASNTEDRTPPASIPSSPSFASQKAFGPGPTPAQTAYIQRILAGPPTLTNGFAADDPLARLRAANGGEGTAVNQSSPKVTGLEESLQAFTSVEVLEGDNAFACKKCWKIKAGRYKDDSVAEEAEVIEEEPSEEDQANAESNTLGVSISSLRSVQPPSIQVSASETDLERKVPADHHRAGRSSSATRKSSASLSNSYRAHSPLRNVLGQGRDDTASLTTVESSIPADTDQDSSDGLSETSSEDEPPPGSGPDIARPKLARQASTHYVLRRAFKRYLVAKAPEVLVFHFKRFKQMHKSSLTFATSFYDLKK